MADGRFEHLMRIEKPAMKDWTTEMAEKRVFSNADVSSKVQQSSALKICQILNLADRIL